MDLPPLYTTQHIVDRAIQLAEGWLKAERERIEECRMPSDYEPAAAELSSYLHTAIKDYARSHGESCARMAREEERANIRALVLDDAWALTFQTFGQYRTALAAAIRKGA